MNFKGLIEDVGVNLEMTAKRFSLKYIDEEHISANIYDNGTFIASVSIGEELLIEVLNQVVEENEQLKKELDCFKPLIFENDGMPIILYEKKDDGDME